MPFANRSNAPGLDWVSEASAEVYLLLARTKLRENSSEDAAGLLDRALQLDPGNAEALALKRKLDGRASISPQSAAKP